MGSYFEKPHNDWGEDCKLGRNDQRIVYDDGICDIYVGEMQTGLNGIAYRQGDGFMKYVNGDVYHGHYTRNMR